VRSVIFRPRAWDDLNHWHTADRKMLGRILRLIGECQRTPYTGTGKPEPLRNELSGYWSRRIDGEHRLVYRANAAEVAVMSARYHYERR
jgi:toxin YoeB